MFSWLRYTDIYMWHEHVLMHPNQKHDSFLALICMLHVFRQKNISVVVPVIYINFHDVVGTKKKPKGHHFIYWIWLKSFVSFERNMKETLITQYFFPSKNLVKLWKILWFIYFENVLQTTQLIVVFIFNLIYLFDRDNANQIIHLKQEL